MRKQRNKGPDSEVWTTIRENISQETNISEDLSLLVLSDTLGASLPINSSTRRALSKRLRMCEPDQRERQEQECKNEEIVTTMLYDHTIEVLQPVRLLYKSTKQRSSLSPSSVVDRLFSPTQVLLSTVQTVYSPSSPTSAQTNER